MHAVYYVLILLHIGTYSTVLAGIHMSICTVHNHKTVFTMIRLL